MATAYPTVQDKERADPGPWAAWAQLRDGKFMVVATGAPLPYPVVAVNLTAANAKRIERSVNCHEELVRVVQAVLQYCAENNVVLTPELNQDLRAAFDRAKGAA